MKKIQIRLITFLLVIMLVSLAAISCRPTLVEGEDISTQSQEEDPIVIDEAENTQQADTEIDKQDNTVDDIEADQDEEVPGYLTIYEGLHITGTHVDVDIEEYRLTVQGEVEKQIELSFEEVKALDSVRIYSELNCPGFFIDKGNWTGVPLKTILELAGIKEGASEVSFISIDESYQKNIPLEEAFEDGMLIAYEFEDEEFSKYHGFPLRLVADEKAGSYWVKWLGTIEVI
jgi:sulfoxide reductase catalytic subunit YedY